MKVKSESEVAQSCPTLSDPMDCSLPGSSIHGIFQARVLEWGAIAFSLGSYKNGRGGVLPCVAYTESESCSAVSDSDPKDCTVHGILQARILELVAIPLSKDSSQPWDQTQVSRIAGGFFSV